MDDYSILTDIELWVVESENVHRPEIQPMKLPVEAKLSIAQKTKLIGIFL